MPTKYYGDSFYCLSVVLLAINLCTETEIVLVI